MTPKKTPSDDTSPAPKSPASPPLTPATPVDITLPLHYAAIVQRTLEQSLTARGHEGARMLVTILDAFAAAVGDYALPEEVAGDGQGNTE